MRVVVPAHDEAEHLPEHLRSLGRAVDVLRRAWPDLDVEVLVVLDACTDDSVDVVRRHRGIRALEVDHRCVGAARRDGVAAARPRRTPPEGTWIACTDADSRVPPDWLTHQVALAERGTDLVLGTVLPDLPEQPLLRAWRARHVLGDGHPHVHGANLGIRLSAYDEAGGFQALASSEDVALAGAVVAAGGVVHRSGRAAVRTSARTRGRAPLGFAAYLLALVVEVEA